jgi:hypothetical protein
MNKIPATIHSWDGKVCRVSIEGYTDGANVQPQAEVCFPLGDKPAHTDFRLLKGDAVWVEFNNGNPNEPFVVGFRNKNTGTAKGYRRLHHDNIEMAADAQFNIAAAQTKITAPTTIIGDLIVQGNIRSTGNMKADGTMTDSDGNNGA